MNIDPPSLITYILFLIIDIGIRVYAIGVIPNNRKPSDATAWIIVIFFLPLLGFIAYALFGHSKLSHKRRTKQRKINDIIYSKTNKRHTIAVENDAPDWFNSIAFLNTKLGALPLVGGNSVRILESDYNTMIEHMSHAIQQAQHFVHVEFYIMSMDATTKGFFASLAAAQKRGVKVRVLLDHIGSMQYPDYKATIAFFKEHDIEYHLMVPFQLFRKKFQRPDLRNHRKLMIIDGTLGFTGSQNIIDSSYNKKKNIQRGLHWLDLMVELRGPVVRELNAVFIGDWYAESDELLHAHIEQLGAPLTDEGNDDCQIVSSGPGFDSDNNVKLFVSLMYAAQKKLIITSPYFVPDESMLIAITAAAERGVHVELFVSEIGDQLMVYHAQRSYYEALLKVGVKIYMYSAPTVLHTKAFSVDDSIGVIGSSNMDMRSLNLNQEISLLVYSKTFVSSLRSVEHTYRSNSRELTLHEWLSRPKRHKLIDNAARLTSAIQ